MGAKTSYEFVNNQTGNKIGYLTLGKSLSKEKLNEKLEAKKSALATKHKLNSQHIYWQDQENPIK